MRWDTIINRAVSYAKAKVSAERKKAERRRKERMKRKLKEVLSNRVKIGELVYSFHYTESEKSGIKSGQEIRIYSYAPSKECLDRFLFSKTIDDIAEALAEVGAEVFVTEQDRAEERRSVPLEEVSADVPKCPEARIIVTYEKEYAEDRIRYIYVGRYDLETNQIIGWRLWKKLIG